MKYKQILLGIIICIFLEFLIYNLNHKFEFFPPIFTRTSNFGVARENNSKYKFTNPLLDYENIGMGVDVVSYRNANNKVEYLRNKNKVLFTSVYFRDLNNGQWFGVNEKEPLVAASLMKLPIFMVMFKESERDSNFLNKKILVSPEDIHSGSEQIIKPRKSFVPGETYTLLEIGKQMVQESDNNAVRIILKNIDRDHQIDLFESIGVPLEEEEEVKVRVKDFASFFRVLFNSSFLSRENSEEVLKILSEGGFSEGIVSGVPDSIIVSHKFGGRPIFSNDLLVSLQLHDCGVVYYPGRPYILCIMTRGTSYQNQESFIKEVSEYFYKRVSEKSKKSK